MTFYLYKDNQPIQDVSIFMTDGQTDGWTDVRGGMDGRMDGRTNAHADEQTIGRADREQMDER